MSEGDNSAETQGIYSLKKFEKSCNLYRWNDLYKCQENVNGTNC